MDYETLQKFEALVGDLMRSGAAGSRADAEKRARTMMDIPEEKQDQPLDQILKAIANLDKRVASLANDLAAARIELQNVKDAKQSQPSDSGEHAQIGARLEKLQQTIEYHHIFMKEELERHKAAQAIAQPHQQPAPQYAPAQPTYQPPVQQTPPAPQHASQPAPQQPVQPAQDKKDIRSRDGFTPEDVAVDKIFYFGNK
ncbi:hypothetical protein AUJ68_07280 [Candidatus Woesearchaeota archaeon CG1_02_57_44]|nr:MAG: hypothetical protein AUJ68_07280 [Candidatus Woesearchaeota archaeon CG1_02_57_44]